MFSSRKNQNALVQNKLECNNSYAMYQDISKSSYEKMPVVYTDKNLSIKNIKNSSRNPKDGGMYPISLKSTELDNSVLSKDSKITYKHKNKQMVSFEKPNNFKQKSNGKAGKQQNKAISKLLSTNGKNRMLAKLISLHISSKKEQIKIRDEHNHSTCNKENKIMPEIDKVIQSMTFITSF